MKMTTPIEKIENYGFAKRYGVLITKLFKNYAEGVYHPDFSHEAIIELRRYLDIPIYLAEVSLEDFTAKLTKQYETKATGAFQVAQDLGENIDLKELIQNLPVSSDLLESEDGAPVIRLINALLREAINKKASDIHFETFEKILLVRFRIDGILQNVLEVPNILSPQIISRLKVMSTLDISEKRLPQDGRITVRIADRAVDIRVSTIPVNHGERVVLRILDKKNMQLNLSELGMNQILLSQVRRMISKPYGILLVTGPTGSGKTTSLYAMLTELNIPDRNIMTVEDPIEYDLIGIAQTQVNPKIDMTFARSLRAILRQDPDIVMVGEIRDFETAIISIQASLTGHFVLSTLHTNNAISSITRLKDMGIESFLLSSSLIGIISQRLIRLLCPNCKKPNLPTKEECLRLGILENNKCTIYTANGCDYCHEIGYINRIGIYEIIEIDAEIKTMIHENVSEQELESYARKKSPSMWQNACQYVLNGQTSVNEIVRITNE